MSDYSRNTDPEFQLVFISSAAMVTAARSAATVMPPLPEANRSRVPLPRSYGIGLHRQRQEYPDPQYSWGSRNQKSQGSQRQKTGLTRLGSNSHYFVIQALRKYGLGATDLNFIQTGGQAENLAALLSGAVDAATMTGPSGGVRAMAQGFRHVVDGPDLHIPFAAATLVARRSSIRTRGTSH